MEAARSLRDVFADLADPATGHEDASSSAPDPRAFLAEHADLPDELLVTAIGSYANTAPAEVAEHLADFIAAPGADAERGLELLTSAPVGNWEGEVELDGDGTDVDDLDSRDPDLDGLVSAQPDIDDLDGDGTDVDDLDNREPDLDGLVSAQPEVLDLDGEETDIDGLDGGSHQDGDAESELHLGDLGIADSLDGTSAFGAGDDSAGPDDEYQAADSIETVTDDGNHELQDSHEADSHDKESHEEDSQYAAQRNADQPTDLDDLHDLPGLDDFDA